MRQSVRGVRNLDGMPKGHSGSVRQLSGTAPVPARAAGVVMLTGHPTIPRRARRRPWPAVAAVPDPRPAAPNELPCPRWLPQGPLVSTLVAGLRSAAGHRPGVRAPRTPAWPSAPAWPPVPDTSRPEGVRPGSSGRSIRRSLPRYSFLYSSQGRPTATGAPASPLRTRPVATDALEGDALRSSTTIRAGRPSTTT